MKRFKDLPWKKKEKLYIIVLVISMLINIFATACFIYTYKIIFNCMAIV